MLKRSIFLLAFTKGNSGYNSELQHIPFSSAGVKRTVYDLLPNGINFRVIESVLIQPYNSETGWLFLEELGIQISRA